MYNIVLETNEATVVTEYTPIRKRRAYYQSEAELEKIFIQDLVEQGYEYLEIKTEDDLVENLKVQLENLIILLLAKLNGCAFTDSILQTIQKELSRRLFLSRVTI